MIDNNMNIDTDQEIDQSNIKDSYFNIATNNVSGISEPVKQEQIMNLIVEKSIDVFGLSETKLKTRTAKLLYRNDLSYTSWWGCDNDHLDATGVGLIIYNNISKYVQKVKHYKGRVIHAILFLKGKIKLCIMQVYIQAHDLDKKEKIACYKYIIDNINQCRKEKIEIIIMGDFNVDLEILVDLECSNVRSIHWKYTLVQKLKNNHFVDVDARSEDNNLPQFTWTNGRETRRLDQIWLQASLQNEFILAETYSPHIYNTNHKVLQANFLKSGIFQNLSIAKEKRNNSYIMKYNYKKTTEKQWEKFANTTDNYVESHDAFLVKN